MPKNSSASMMTSRSMNSTAVGMTFERMMTGTVSIACFKVGNGTSNVTVFFGSGMSFSVAFVTMPSVPSEPMIISLMS